MLFIFIAAVIHIGMMLQLAKTVKVQNETIEQQQLTIKSYEDLQNKNLSLIDQVERENDKLKLREAQILGKLIACQYQLTKSSALIINLEDEAMQN